MEPTVTELVNLAHDHIDHCINSRQSFQLCSMTNLQISGLVGERPEAGVGDETDVHSGVGGGRARDDQPVDVLALAHAHVGRRVHHLVLLVARVHVAAADR